MDVMKWARAQWDRVAAVAALVGALVLLLVGWLGVSDSVYPAEQLPYLISCGLLGVVLLGTAGTLWLSADLRDEWRKLDRLEERLAAKEAMAATSPPATRRAAR